MYIYLMNSKLLRGTLDSIILKLLSEKKEMYGYEITREVKELTHGEVELTEGALYPALHRLESKGILDSSTRFIGNRYRKYYSLTESGKEETEVALSEMNRYMEALQLIFQTSNRSLS